LLGGFAKYVNMQHKSLPEHAQRLLAELCGAFLRLAHLINLLFADMLFCTWNLPHNAISFNVLCIRTKSFQPPM